MDVAANAAVSTNRVKIYPQLYAVGTLTKRYTLDLDARRFAMRPPREIFTVRIDISERETVHVPWRRFSKHYSKERGLHDLTQSSFVDMPSVFCFEEVDHVDHLTQLITHLRAQRAVPSDVKFDLWCGSRDFCEDVFASSHKY